MRGMLTLRITREHEPKRVLTISGIPSSQLEVKLRDHGNLRGEVSTITLHMEQKEEKERLARQRVENLEVGKKFASRGASVLSASLHRD